MKHLKHIQYCRLAIPPHTSKVCPPFQGALANRATIELGPKIIYFRMCIGFNLIIGEDLGAT